MNIIPNDIQFRLQVADTLELDLIANRWCNPPLYRMDGECDLLFRQRITEHWKRLDEIVCEMKELLKGEG